MYQNFYYSLPGPKGEKIFLAYAEQNIKAAYRVFFYDGPHQGKPAIFAIIPHPSVIIVLFFSFQNYPAIIVYYDFPRISCPIDLVKSEC